MASQVSKKCELQAILTIDEYIIKNNLILSNNDIFLELWIPLFNKKEILITEKLLEFMGFCDNNNTCGKNARVINRYKLHNFIEFLKNNDIKFEQIDYKNKK